MLSMESTFTIDYRVSKTIEDFLANASELFEAKVRETVNARINQASQYHLTYPECFDHEKMLEGVDVSKEVNSSHLMNKCAGIYKDRIQMSDCKDNFQPGRFLQGCPDARHFVNFIKLCNTYDMPIVYCSYKDELYPNEEFYIVNKNHIEVFSPTLSFVTSHGLIIRRSHYIQTDRGSVNNYYHYGHHYTHFHEFFNEENIKKWSLEHAKYPKIPADCYTKEQIEGFRLGLIHSSPYTAMEIEFRNKKTLNEIQLREKNLADQTDDLKFMRDEFEKSRADFEKFKKESETKIDRMMESTKKRRANVRQLEIEVDKKNAEYRKNIKYTEIISKIRDILHTMENYDLDAEITDVEELLYEQITTEANKVAVAREIDSDD